VPLRRGVVSSSDELGALDAEAIAAAEEQAMPVVRDADELHDAMLSLLVVPSHWAPPAWAAFLPALIEANRATVVAYGAHRAWVAAERLPLVRAALGELVCEPVLPPLPFEVDVPEAEQAIADIVAAHLDHVGPRTAAALAACLGIDVTAVDAALLGLEAAGSVMRGYFTAGARDAVRTEWCNRRVLSRIHRMTLSRLRKQIQPVTAAALMRFLFRWQCLHAGGRRSGVAGLRACIDQLQGFDCAAGAWEHEILPARVRGYDSTWLDTLCLAGEVTWCRLSPGGAGRKPTRATPIALMNRADAAWLRAPGHIDDGELGDEAAAVYQHLSARGASFTGDIAAATGMDDAAVVTALWELVGAGLATADGFAGVRAHVDRSRPAPQRQSRHAKWQRVLGRVRNPDAGRARVPAAVGRWGLLVPPQPEDVQAERSARQLLSRYGVVFRDLLVRETTLPPWRDLLVALRRMEARGEIRGGRFVSGFVGEQFALPEAVDGLRAMRKTPEQVELVRAAATDPLNLVGVTSAGPKVAAVVGNAILYRNGVPIAALEAGEMQLRCELEPGERVDEELVYHAPPRAETAVTPVRVV